MQCNDRIQLASTTASEVCLENCFERLFTHFTPCRAAMVNQKCLCTPHSLLTCQHKMGMSFGWQARLIRAQVLLHICCSCPLTCQCCFAASLGTSGPSSFIKQAHIKRLNTPHQTVFIWKTTAADGSSTSICCHPFVCNMLPELASRNSISVCFVYRDFCRVRETTLLHLSASVW